MIVPGGGLRYKKDGECSSNSGRCGGLTVSALDSGASGLGSSPGRGHCVVFLGKCHSASLHSGEQIGTGEFIAGGDPVMD